jgi:hypothetical protein
MKMVLTGLVVAMLTAGISKTVYASSGSGPVTQLTVGPDSSGTGQGVAVIARSSSSITGTTCNGSSKTVGWAIDLGMTWGRSMYSLALAAYLSGRSMTLYGAGTCSVQGNGNEDRWYGFM